jgi:hypothetical protein
MKTNTIWVISVRIRSVFIPANTGGSTLAKLGAAAPRPKSQKPYSIWISTLFAPAWPKQLHPQPSAESPQQPTKHNLTYAGVVSAAAVRDSSNARLAFLLPRPYLSFSFCSPIPLCRLPSTAPRTSDQASGFGVRSAVGGDGWPPGLPGRCRLADRRPALLQCCCWEHQRSSPTSLLLCDPSKSKELHHSLFNFH